MTEYILIGAGLTFVCGILIGFVAGLTIDHLDRLHDDWDDEL